MNMIIFNDNYPKLHNQTSARLLAIEAIRMKRETYKELIEYDTIKSDGAHYPLEESAQYLQLILLGNKRIPFCTLRKYSGYGLNYYKNQIGKEFKIVIKKDPKI